MLYAGVVSQNLLAKGWTLEILQLIADFAESHLHNVTDAAIEEIHQATGTVLSRDYVAR